MSEEWIRLKGKLSKYAVSSKKRIKRVVQAKRPNGTYKPGGTILKINSSKCVQLKEISGCPVMVNVDNLYKKYF